jgi:phosphosulfolactate phosphohydrolase-like enzyme
MRSPERPLLLLSPVAGFLATTGGAPASYVACLRNMTATVDAIAKEHARVVLVAAGHEGRSRCEDQMVAGWMAARLVERGYTPGGLQTARHIERWSRADLSVLGLGRGADHLRRLGRDADLDFVLHSVDDLQAACRYYRDEVRATWPAPLHRVVATAH